MPAGEARVRLAALQQALTRLGAAPLGATRREILVGYQELELALDWDQAQALEPEAAAETVIELAAQVRAAESDWEAVAPSLLPVLWGRGEAADLARRAPNLLAWPWAEELVLTVAQGTPLGRRYLGRDDCPGGAAVALAAALENLRGRTPTEAVTAVGAEGQPLYGLACDDGLESSRLLLGTDLLPAFAANGLIGAAPAREMLSFAPFCAAGCRHLRELVNLAANGAASLPFALSSNLFYLSPEGVLRLTVEATPDGPRLHLPEALALRQARLAADGRW
jgi:hypothetical protein